MSANARFPDRFPADPLPLDGKSDLLAFSGQRDTALFSSPDLGDHFDAARTEGEVPLGEAGRVEARGELTLIEGAPPEEEPDFGEVRVGG